MNREVAVVIDSDASLIVRMARAFEQSATRKDIAEFVRDWVDRFDVKLPDEEIEDAVCLLAHRGIYWWNETYCLQICKAD